MVLGIVLDHLVLLDFIAVARPDVRVLAARGDELYLVVQKLVDQGSDVFLEDFEQLCIYLVI